MRWIPFLLGACGVYAGNGILPGGSVISHTLSGLSPKQSVGVGYLHGYPVMWR